MKKPNSSLPAAASTKIKFQNSDDEDEDSIHSSSDQEEEEENELADVTFEELQKARSDGTDFVVKKTAKENKTGRANKNRPMEMSAKKPVSRFREIIQVPKKVVRDPRFESLCGNYDDEGFKKRYNFLYQNDFPAEKEDLKRQLKKATDPEVISEMKNRIAMIDKQLKSAAPKLNNKVILTEHKKKEREAAKQGKAPYYLKNSDIQKQKHIEKFNQLKASGKLESYMEKKRKKNAAKDRKYMPYSRPSKQVNE